MFVFLDCCHSFSSRPYVFASDLRTLKIQLFPKLCSMLWQANESDVVISSDLKEPDRAVRRLTINNK